MSRGFILYGFLLLVALVLVVANYDPPMSWRKTFSRYDQNPYGSKALGVLINDVFSAGNVTMSNQTLYEVFSEENTFDNLIVIAESFYPDETSLNSLLENVSAGHTAFISANNFSWQLLDSLDFTTDRANYAWSISGTSADSMSLVFENLDTAYYSMTELNTSFDSIPENATTHILNQEGKPVLMIVPYGDGQFILNTTPILFTNFFFLYEDNHKYVSVLLSYMPDEPVTWTEYYQVGSLESGSPFREILEYASLRNAFYLTLCLILLYLIFESKREQRAIPVIKPYPNQTLDFVKTVGALFFHKKDPLSAAKNKLNYFKDHCKLQYGIVIHWDQPQSLMAKTGIEITVIKKLFDMASHVESADAIGSNDLISVNDYLNNFYHLTGHSKISVK